MKIEQIYTGCLAQGAYYIESKGEAAIIDPLREVDSYIAKAKEDGATIKYIFETHFHADFVSGHVDLAQKTGGQIVYGPNAETAFESHIGTDGEVFELGDVRIKLLHTPGHTMESSTYLLYDESGREHAIFSGDTLFIGDVGRPDLAVKTDLTRNDLASHLFDSLRDKIMTLPDEVIVYPAHGAGSACGKNMSKETWDTLGNQKEVNYALRADMTREEFIKEVTSGILPPPQYFAKNAMMNKSGYDSIDEVMAKGNVALDVDVFEAMANHEGALVLDTRSKTDFVASHIPNAIFIGIDGSFAPWVGALITDLKQPIVLVADEGREEEVLTRLSRVGYDNTLGYLKGGMTAWKQAGKDTDSIESVTAEELGQRMASESMTVMDVRKPGEYSSEHVDGALFFPLDFINDNMDGLDKSEKYYIHCASGYRSVIASSILKSRGFHNIADVAGGFKAIQETGIKKSDYVCPSTLK
ncbi:rhodanese-like domain-containing protein [Reichenbachiella sp. MSK19-1]|uniref:MBL fold metallo-hydrolase n=1 Tax=Reichenbachiella sp. MSK19-1 TaxID=1897631 RepID=UPI000E6BFB88|nr:MBL fold metallo-hydrolase [Reichenbachiella sp. MSK19-1]RJE73086.1 MBL fold metallo-hydrolase [Reichenbachiella sp. MSK19-1]